MLPPPPHFFFVWFICAVCHIYIYIHNMAVVTQFYITEAENEYVISKNAAVMKCKIPSFVADFVHVEAWINAEDGTVLTASNDSSTYGYFSFSLPLYLLPYLFRVVQLSTCRYQFATRLAIISTRYVVCTLLFNFISFHFFIY